ncbi:MAG TPA: FAD-dependent monooxygenase, partial [Verrucomicrobiae bacterium]
RIDWQLGADIEVEKVLTPESLGRLIRQTIGERAFEIAWVTTYVFHERLASRLRVGRVFLLGDAAHLMSPFGARGMNSGVQDAADLAWKLWLVMNGRAPERLLDTYETERRAAAIENLQITDASMQFITPQSRARLLLRNAILRVSVHLRWARRWVNAGRLSMPFAYRASPIVDRRLRLPPLGKLLFSLPMLKASWRFWRGPSAGQIAPDATYAAPGQPNSRARVIDLIGPHFLVLFFSDNPMLAARELRAALANTSGVPIKPYVVTREPAPQPAPTSVGQLFDDEGHFCRKFAAQSGTLYLIRPDGHIATRGLEFPLSELADALRHAVGAERSAPNPTAASAGKEQPALAH